MLGLNPKEVKLVSHNPEWTQLYQQEELLLKQLVGNDAVGIEHIGSTAIQDIHAKPIIDIMVGVRSLNPEDRLDLKQMRKGYYYPLQKQTMEGKIIFAKFPEIDEGNHTKTHYIHVVKHGGDWWKAHINFRDRLKESPGLAREYEDLKLKLAKSHPNDAMAYGQAKEEFINRVIGSEQDK
ncbi:GrpB family protein [Aquisalibacillus elongatus]|uniref:GrpB-like predicted nucleotidyltransferase (UPF0157 family) n=1 Tax=Aquisalibacillus elongatus TaxID=485577 RepID=A0A3N5B8S2_9BACI|nr:GrpB family protein [Aquisalibacillus elongatus]RPF53874.1 GrpB-like predicted nucleotidyltransferase (UPF0157 family) [Aquisalibacillus elongatus]